MASSLAALRAAMPVVMRDYIVPETLLHATQHVHHLEEALDKLKSRVATSQQRVSALEKQLEYEEDAQRKRMDKLLAQLSDLMGSDQQSADGMRATLIDLYEDVLNEEL